MPDDIKSHSPSEVPDSRRKMLVAFLPCLVIGLVFWVTTSSRRKREGSVERPLPRSIEEFRTALHQPDFGMFFVDFSHALPSPNNELTVANARRHLYELMGRRDANMGSTDGIGNLIADYSAVVRKRISFGRSWLKATNEISYDDAMPRTRRETLDLIESILRTNGGFVFPLNRTNSVLLTAEDLKNLGQALPNRGH